MSIHQATLEIPEYQQDTLKIIRQLGEQLITLKETLEATEAQGSKIKEAIREITEQKLPNLMDELQIESMTLSDGTNIKCGDFIDAKITDQETAFRWLRETNNDGIIKNDITVSLERGQDSTANEVMEVLRDMGVSFAQKEVVHPQTLKAFIRETIKNNTAPTENPLPETAFGVYKARRVSFK